jgi:DNA-binding SARP family transcriptional activator
VRFTVLGEVSAEGSPRLRPKQRELLAALIVRIGHRVHAEQLAAELWDEPPASAVAGVHAHASRLRASLAKPDGSSPLHGGASGYSLEGYLDARDFEELFAQARGILLDGHFEDAVAHLERALDMWHGPAYGRLAARPFARAEAARLEELRRAAEDDLLTALVELGRADDALVRVAPLIASEPLRERLWAVRMIALARTGRQSEALADYRHLHRLLDAELGVLPDPALRDLHSRLVRQQPLRLAPVGRPPGPEHPTPRVHQGPVVRWADSGGTHIAYQVVGEGRRDVLYIPSYLSHLELHWQCPPYADFLRALGQNMRLIIMDKRGVGLSDRVQTADLSIRAADVRAVLDAVGSATATVFASSEGATSAVPFAVESPERLDSLILFG